MEITTKFIKNAKSIRKWKDLNKDDKKLMRAQLLSKIKEIRQLHQRLRMSDPDYNS